MPSLITVAFEAVKKHEGDEMLSGSFLVAGSGVARVIHVGSENYATILAAKAKDKKRATSEMQDSIGRIIKIVGFLIVPVGILLFLSQRAIEGTTTSDAIVNTVAGVIGMIPEGLVLLTSVSFILGVGRLARKQALVPVLSRQSTFTRASASIASISCTNACFLARRPTPPVIWKWWKLCLAGLCRMRRSERS